MKVLKRKLKHYFSGYYPLETKEDVDDLIDALKSRNTVVNPETKDKLIEICNEELKSYLEGLLQTYIDEYKPIPGIPKPKPKGKGKSRKSKMNPTNSFYKHNYPDSLAAKGYEYGLSDW